MIEIGKLIVQDPNYASGATLLRWEQYLDCFNFPCNFLNFF